MSAPATQAHTDRYEIVLGVEVHAQLATATKLFCGCSTRFGAPPNTQTCPVCLGLPGVLPVLNRKAFEYAVVTALALGCEVARRTSFDRKNYYYPDLPKNYQISQNYVPLGTGGALEIPSGRRVGIHNVHLEEDAGKLLHDETGREVSVVDLNRAGIPLVEIVSAPDMRSLSEVEEFMETLRQTLTYLGVSECRMQEGNLRFEASISLRPRGSTELGPRVEIKNLNSVKHVLGALAFEAKRQAQCLDRGEPVERETRLYDEASGETARMRSKEEAHDYRYFPEPDLAPIEVSEEWLAALRSRIPELPRARRARLASQYGITEYDAGVIASERALADYFEELARACGEPKAAANWITNDVLKQLNERRLALREFAARVGPARLAELIDLARRGVVSGSAARQEVLPAMVETGRPADEIVRSRGLAQESDRATLAAIVESVLDANPKPVGDWLKGKQAAIGFLTGLCMKASKGKGNPTAFGDLLKEALERRRAGK